MVKSTCVSSLPLAADAIEQSILCTGKRRTCEKEKNDDYFAITFTVDDGGVK